MGSLALRPGDSLTILEDGFVNRLQEFQFPSSLLFKLRGFDFYPGGTRIPLFMPAFAGRTHPGTNPQCVDRGSSGMVRSQVSQFLNAWRFEQLWIGRPRRVEGACQNRFAGNELSGRCVMTEQ